MAKASLNFCRREGEEANSLRSNSLLSFSSLQQKFKAPSRACRQTVRERLASMAMTVRRYGLRDDQWERISELLPGRKGQVGRPAQDNRRFVEAVLYRYRAGIAWRDLPPRFGDWKNTHRRFSRWAQRGVWLRVFGHLSQDADNEYAMIDSTIVRAHQHSAGARKKTAPKPSAAAKAD